MGGTFGLKPGNELFSRSRIYSFALQVYNPRCRSYVSHSSYRVIKEIMIQ